MRRRDSPGQVLHLGLAMVRLVLIDDRRALWECPSIASVDACTAGKITVMSLGSIHDSRMQDRSAAEDLARGILWVGWHAVRIPILALLLILEPVVILVLWGAALLGVLTSFLFEFAGATPDFPFLLMISISVGCAVLAMAYHALLRLLS